MASRLGRVTVDRLKRARKPVELVSYSNVSIRL